MKFGRTHFIALISVFLFQGIISCSNEVAKISSQCNIDLNFDSVPDTVIYSKHGDTYKLVASIRKDEGFVSYLIGSSKQRMDFTCVTGDRVLKTIAGTGDHEVKEVDTGGAYILMRQSEGAAIVYYMKNGKFHEIRIAG